MKKTLCVVVVLCTLVSLAACGSKAPEQTSAGFKPLLDTDTSCSITVAGSYDNFEALETEFDRFSEFYPNVQLSYVKLDDYNNVLSTVLEGNDKPNIFFSHAWMIGSEKYAPVFAHMEELSDEALGLDLDCIRPGLSVISPEVLGIKDPLTVQIRNAAFRVGIGEITVDEAVAMYGTFE